VRGVVCQVVEMVRIIPQVGEKRMQLSKQLVEGNWPLTDVSVRQVLQEFGERVVTVITAKEG
jgi:hypothetical protein